MDLRQAQKLEALGRLAAGIAHEINTPAQFLGDNLHFLSEAFKNLLDVLRRHEQAVARFVEASGHKELAEEFKAAEEASDLPYQVDVCPVALADAQEGVSRISAIVKAMKEFAHTGPKEVAAADLNRALQATLTVARNEYKHVADVETAFGPIPTGYATSAT